MSADPSLQALDVFEDLLSTPPHDRVDVLDRLCAGNDALREQVLALLRQDESGVGFEDRELRAGDLAERVLAAGSEQVSGERSWLPPVIGGYRIERELGAGGMGIVFEAHPTKGGDPVAIKVLRPGCVSPERVRRFQRETAVLKGLDHPGIARVLQAGVFPSGASGSLELPYLAMELLRGKDLLEHVRTQAASRTECLQLIACVADAVAHAHERGVIHRDLKPENVLVVGDGTPKVLDFGIARAGELESFVSTFLTTTGELLGTIDYMAPELLLGERDAVTQRCDLHGLGVLCFELLTGTVPRNTRGQPLTKALRALSLEPPRPLRELLSQAPVALEALLMRCLHADPERRMDDAAQFAQELRTIAVAWS